MTGPPAAPQRTLADLDRLVTDARAAGLAVHEHRAGDPARVPAAVSREGYRIVQEGLTNAARHGRGPVTLRLGPARRTPWRWSWSTPCAARERADPGRGGRGLDGIRERVLLLGGRLTAGPDGDRWLIRARLPYEDSR